MKTFAWTLVLVLLAIGDAIAQTAPEPIMLQHAPPMGFIVVRSNAPGCEPTCPEWISAQGHIEAGTPALLKALLKKLGHRKLPLVLNSQGGETEAAMALGHMIRAGGLDTMVAKTVFSECAPDAKACGLDDLHFGIANPYRRSLLVGLYDGSGERRTTSGRQPRLCRHSSNHAADRQEDRRQ
ncbi:MAG: hypothetical protein EOS58_18215 [Mesorhizobium sp.]|uniref:hypothetical protein n=1 Tax=unclassified Mesorhizobium TaxID=325217 RepID=UPI000F75F837|nr:MULTISPECIES: hypothetical protein [unclassified Mesorhizobium]AZO47899.1 hypothetical protein EJ073_08745 [Mesorhizobium sp. M4B.F.Ca.ET.058.02.1.1]RVC39905.1 hypothetical protein EN781_31410 [Mesorhizobium sp. M4A.F.Ca.ET.090.04.2.1]RWC54228.1 MAG: hypothetical protein EOS54_10955 [Mesorhizobium sp.]RWD03312.1 MAG: hypothetical protein EOS58_18215 [Mesorhizobium sp.]RWD12154.1 MAG: hypothetical protein EOS74_23920 [Mesorhizobium sp.]